MKQDLIIKNNEDRWPDLVTQLNLSIEDKEYWMKNTKLTKVSVNKKASEISLFLSTVRPKSDKSAGLIFCLQQIFKGIGSVNVIFQKNNLDLKEVFSNHAEELLKYTVEQIPSSIGWLKNCQWITNNSNLTLAVASELGAKFLKEKKCVDFLKSYIKDNFLLDVNVQIVFDPSLAQSNEDLDNYEDLLKAKFIEFATECNSNDKAKNINSKSKESDKKILYGKKITGYPTKISLMVEEEKDTVLIGYIFDIDFKIFRSGRSMLSFAMSDNTDSIYCKVIGDNAEISSLAEQVNEKNWYKIRGPIQFDKYSQELTVLVKDIVLDEMPNIRMDYSKEKRVELHLHTKMSSMDGISHIKELIKRAKIWEHEAIAITDHGVVQSFPEAYDIAKKEGVKLIFGLEAYIFNDTINERKIPNYHCIILAKNPEGLKALYSLVTVSHLANYSRVPRIPKTLLGKNRGNLIIGSACEAGELIQGIIKNKSHAELKEIAEFYDYLEIQPIGNNRFLIDNGTYKTEDDLKDLNKKVVQIAHELNKPIVATGDVHFLDPEDEIYRRILMAGKGFSDADNQPPLYYRTTDEMLQEFSYLGSEISYEAVIRNPKAIAESIESMKPIPDELYSPVIDGAEDEIRRLTLTTASNLYGENLPETVQKRLDKELNSIINNGFSVLYLIAQKLVKKSNDDGYLVGSRGSVGSSLVATFTGITEVNPLPPHYRCPKCKYSNFIEDGTVGSGADLPDAHCPTCSTNLVKDGHDIPFEVFLGFDGDKVPDIDLNFSGEYQPRAHKYTEELFGKDNVFRAGTIATIADKTAFGFVKKYFEERNITKKGCEISRLSKGCVGVKRTTGQHPGGLMVLPKGLDIHQFTPLQRPADDTSSDITTTHFDYHSISSRLVKLDLLGHDDPTVIKMLEDLTGIDAKTIPLDDPKTMSLFSSVDALGICAEELGSTVGTFGIPEFGTKFVRQMLVDTMPTTFSELVRISGFSHGTDVWLNNAQDLIKEGKCKLSEAISARDDIMTYLIYQDLEPIKAFKIMENVRKGKGLKQEEIDYMKENNVPDWYIGSCQKIKYMFPKAHAVAYVMMAFRIAYFKVYYPTAFYASFFTVRADEFDADIIVKGQEHIKLKMNEIIQKGNDASQKDKNLLTILELALEMYLRGISLTKVDLTNSHCTKFRILKEGEILPSLSGLQGVGETAANNLYNARMEGPFTSVDDLRNRTKVTKTVIDALRQHGCLEGMPESDQLALF